LATLGELLEQRGLRYDLLAVGGGALLLLGLLTRPTKDIDIVGVIESGNVVVSRTLPEPLQRAIGDTAIVLGLRPDWLNTGPASLTELGLPDGALARAVIRDWRGLRLRLSSRLDQIHFKLYAAVDQGPESRHFADLRLLAPTSTELIAAARWARTHDPSEAFRGELIAALRDLGVTDVEL
jgi:hypothetical protein